ncbi:helix-turn-helix transcriptional regulator [Nonomuraea fastidiosa]|uniref:helix-turn-helix transcriptional regulator n=1 Tax=Nonomuraea fastidiosa TaxID=46173 RepID=UPI00366B44FD
MNGWRGRAAITPGRFYYGGHIGAAAMHAHYAVQLLIGDGLILRGGDGTAHELTAALIPANTRHAIVRGTDAGLLALIDPAQAGDLAHPPGTGSAAAGAIDLSPPPRHDLPTLIALADEITGTVPAAHLHPGLAQAMRLIDETLPGQVRLSALADAVHLSESRLAHLFREQAGLPFRPYVLWMRLRLALYALADGGTLTDAAHTAGFSDSAHLSRTIRRMMGDAPSVLSAGVRWLRG